MPEWRVVSNALPVALCMLDATGRIVTGNRAFQALVGASEARMRGEPWLAVVPPAWADAVHTALETPDASLPPAVHTGGRAFRVTAYRIEEEGAGHVLVFDDQTAQRQLQQLALELAVLGNGEGRPRHAHGRRLAGAQRRRGAKADAEERTPAHGLPPPPSCRAPQG